MEYIKVTDFEKWIIRCIKTYPSIFPNRWYVLNHIFCVIGNGYEWSEDGYLVTDNNRAEDYWVNLDYDSFIKDNEWITRGVADEHWRKEYLKRKAIANNSIKLSKIFKPYRNHGVIPDVYPLCEYSMILNFPDNVQHIYHNDMGTMMNYILVNYNEYDDVIRKAMDRLIDIKIDYWNKKKES